MTAVTLEEIKELQTKLNAMIAQAEAQAKLISSFPISVPMPDLNAGERWIGAVISADGTKRHHIILLPGEQESINWQDAMDWAESIGGELPDRTESALLFATAKDEFQEKWYWTREKHASDSDYAWSQYFTCGDQDYYHVLYGGRARAVRRLEIQ